MDGGFGLGELRDLAAVARDVLAAAAILVGAVWAYFKFARGRTFARRLELAVGGEAFRRGDALYLLVAVRAKNLGLSRVKIDREQSGLRVFTHGPEVPVERAAPVAWERLSTLDVFVAREALEPGEPADEELLIGMPRSDYAALRLQLWITAATGEEWEIVSVVNPAEAGDNTDGSETEDGP